ncbi:MAG: hypothetical protein ACOC6D_04890 [Atribacterota bacterium]
MAENNNNLWTPENEREHFPCVMEWWAAISFFKTLEDNKKWSVKGVLNQWCEKSEGTGSLFNFTLFDEATGKHFVYFLKNTEKKLEAAKEGFEVKYNDCYIRGLYPNYEIFFNDKKNNVKLNIKYKAISKPYWVAQEITGGRLPMGTGFLRYGFIPKNELSGTMDINNKIYKIEGKGYFEHVWGDFWYDNPFANLLQLRKTLSIYSKLFFWWIQNHKIKIPDSLIFSTENNPFGYDWAWALLDNGWTLFYGNMLLFMMNGPAAGSLILSKDGKTYTEFGNVNFRYNKVQYSENFDFLYPTELEVTARYKNEKLYLIFKMTTDCREYFAEFTKAKHWLGFIICEAPGKVEGYYFNGREKIPLTGICKIEPQRQLSVIGHNSLKIDFIKPPKGIGVSFELDSHYLKRKINKEIQLVPHPKIKLDLEKIMNST